MLIPRRHVASFFDLTPDEHLSILALLDRARTGIDQEFHPDAFNIGINGGAPSFRHLQAKPGREMVLSAMKPAMTIRAMTWR